MASKPLEKKRERLAHGMAQGFSLRRAARDASIPAATARRWATEPAVRERAAELRSDLISRTVGRMSALSIRSAHTLGKLLASTDENIKLKASHEILTLLLAVREQTELAAQVAELAARLSGRGGGSR